MQVSSFQVGGPVPSSGGCGASGASAQGVVPVVVRRAEALDGGVAGDHGLGHALAGSVSVEAAVDGQAVGQDGGQPGGVGSGARGGDAQAVGIEGAATDGVDGRFAQDDGLRARGADGEVAAFLPRARRHAAPRFVSGSTQFGADGLVPFVAQDEDGVVLAIGVQIAGLDEGT